MCTEVLLERIQMMTIGCLVLAVFNMILLICVVLQPFGSKIKSKFCKKIIFKKRINDQKCNKTEILVSADISVLPIWEMSYRYRYWLIQISVSVANCFIKRLFKKNIIDQKCNKTKLYIQFIFLFSFKNIF